MRQFIRLLGVAWCAAMLLFVLPACAQDETADARQEVRSHLQGHFSVNPELDSTADYRGFEVLVALEAGGVIDTLGFAVTDRAGAFEMDVVAPERGLYPIFVSRRGTALKVDELVVAAGDTAVVDAQFPLGNRPLRIRSTENAAWSAFRNTKAQHNQTLMGLLQGDGYTEEAVRGSILRTSTILWSLRDAFPRTVGRDLASAEAVVMVGGWDDSLALARAAEIEPDNLGFADVARVARLAKTRLDGPEAAIDLVRGFLDRAQDARQRAALRAELVLALIAGEQQQEALQAARSLQQDAPGQEWATWAKNAIYELETLMPGMPAPAVSVRTHDGQAVRLEDLRGMVVVLEFYAPQNEAFQRDLAERKALHDAFAERPFRLLSVSLEPDSLLNDAFFEGRDLPGLHVIAPGGREDDLARRYNVNVLPTRFLIGPDGAIAGKYVGATLPALRRDAEAMLDAGG